MIRAPARLRVVDPPAAVPDGRVGWEAVGGAILALFVATTFLNLDMVLPKQPSDTVKYVLRLVFGLFTVAALVARRDAILPVVRRQALFGALLAWFAVTVAVGLSPGFGTVRLVFFAYTVATALAFALTVGGPAAFVTWAFRGSGILVLANAAVYVVDPTFGADFRDGFGGLSGDKNGAGQFFVVAMILAAYAAGSAPSGTERRIAAGTALLAFALVLTTDSKTSMAMGLAGAAGCALRHRAVGGDRRAAALAAVAGLSALAVAAAGFAASDVTLGWIVLRFEDVTFTNRREIWELVAFAIARRPWTGYGFGSFWQTDPTENPFGRMMQLHVIQTWVNESGHINQAHNGYLDLLLATGLVGFALGLATVWLALRRLVRMMRATPPGSPDRGGLFAAHSLLVWVLLNNMMESTIFYAPVYSLGVVLVLAIVCTDRWWAARQPTSTSVPRVN